MNAKMSLLSLAIVSGLALSGSVEAAGNPRSAAVARANTLVGNHPALVRRAAADTFVARDSIIDADGSEHVRYQRKYRGLPVIGGDFVLHSRNGKVTGVSQSLKTTARPGLAARVSADQAIVEAGAQFAPRFLGAPTARAVVYARGASPVLAHEVVLRGFKPDQTESIMHYIVDATSGRILDSWDDVQTALPGPGGSGACYNGSVATGTGKSLMAGDVVLDTIKCGTQYRLIDATRGGGATHNMAMKTAGMGTVFTGSSNVWGNSLVGNSQSAAADAHYGVAMTWDYFKNVHGRLGIANDGQGVVSRVHYGRNYGNASWSNACFCMTFGDGDNGATILPLVALDIAGHEMTHGVTSRTAGLIYSGESGGLNEATSDIFGTMVEFYANNSNDPADYVMGEELFTNNADMRKAIRYMFKPSLEGPGTSHDCYGPTTSKVGVHYSSGPANRFFYLLAEGAVVPAGFGAGSWANLTPGSLVCNGNTALAGIGRAAAGRIWYRALSVYMTSSTNYAGARVATINAATDLFGAGSAQVNAVKAAWSAVNVN